MKTSLLLLVSLLVLGCVGTARAADAKAQSRVLVGADGGMLAEASTAGNGGVLATLGALFSGATDNCQGNSAVADAGGSDGIGDGDLDAPVDRVDARGGAVPVVPDEGHSRVPAASPGGGSGGKRSSLGWQSLLPGSIQ